MLWASAAANGATAAMTMPIGTIRQHQPRYHRDFVRPGPGVPGSACPLPEATAELVEKEAAPVAPKIIVSKR